MKDSDLKGPEELVKPFFADNYPVTDKMFRKPKENRPGTTAHFPSRKFNPYTQS
ncbi:hypothetical protein LUD75_18720 [Epilithonimonas sp. JDS]|uniref:hypothetical protein n=1 Tax=Epilithonimonas sp. JDS TaxID=2902797 RepID=UPI001E4DA8EE|nr:hypothetical protein [Epilithonimonas sp. JDS]MCD9856764.1 hypothetical protein [Epilithonimonas sp. JDS]